MFERKPGWCVYGNPTHLQQCSCCLCTAPTHSHVQRGQLVQVALVQNQGSLRFWVLLQYNTSLQQQGVGSLGVKNHLHSPNRARKLLCVLPLLPALSVSEEPESVSVPSVTR